LTIIGVLAANILGGMVQIKDSTRP